MTDKRRLELEVEVPGTPEQVWEAIATGPGISAWFADTRIDGDTIVFDLGAGIESTGEVTAVEPPHRFAYEEPLDEAGSRVASEWLVEARSGGTCVVRLVSSLFGTSADWEDELGGMSDGWQAYLHNLRLYLTHFPGRPCSPVHASATSAGTLDEGWAALTAGLGLTGAQIGDEVDDRRRRAAARRRGRAPHRRQLPPRAAAAPHRARARLRVRARLPLPGQALPERARLPVRRRRPRGRRARAGALARVAGRAVRRDDVNCGWVGRLGSQRGGRIRAV